MKMKKNKTLIENHDKDELADYKAKRKKVLEFDAFKAKLKQIEDRVTTLETVIKIS